MNLFIWLPRITRAGVPGELLLVAFHNEWPMATTLSQWPVTQAPTRQLKRESIFDRATTAHRGHRKVKVKAFLFLDFF
jgi:hypothetical protein